MNFLHAFIKEKRCCR